MNQLYCKVNRIACSQCMTVNTTHTVKSIPYIQFNRYIQSSVNKSQSNPSAATNRPYTPAYGDYTSNNNIDRYSNIQNPLSSSSSASSPTAAATATNTSISTLNDDRRIYSSFVIHKGRGALDISIRQPQVQLSRNNRYYTLKRNGSFLLAFANSKGEKQYDWNNKEFFSLDLIEIGELIHFYLHGNIGSNTILSFTHDPQQGSDLQGNTVKKLDIRKNVATSTNKANNGYFFNYSVNRHNDPSSTLPSSQKISIPVSDGEMATMITLMQQTLPSLLAIQTQLTPELVTQNNNPPNSNTYNSEYKYQ